MANDVTIVVSAELGDSLIKLELAKRAVQDLGDSNAEAAIETDKNTESSHRLSDALRFLTGNWKILVPAVAAAGIALLGFTGNLSILLPLVPILTGVLAGLLAPFTTLAAIMAGFIPPLTLIVGLVGGLAVAFGLAAKQAMGGGRLAESLKQLKFFFTQLTTQLVTDFLPTFNFLAQSADHALMYLDRIAHLNLRQAFQSLSTTGVSGLTQFLEKVGAIIGKPIRIAFQIAFGPEGAHIRSAMVKIWTQIVDFFEKPPKTGGPSIASMIGNWFGRQDFTGIGMRWALELAGAVVGALGAAFKHVMSSKGGKIIGGAGLGGAAIGAYIGGPIGAAIGAAMGIAIGVALNHYWPVIRKDAEAAWKSISTSAVQIFHEITTALEHFLGPTTWHNLGIIAKNTWNGIKTVAVAAFKETIRVARTIWQVFDTIVIKTGAWKAALALVKAAIYLVAAVLAPISGSVKLAVQWATRLANHFNGIVLTAVQAVAAVVAGIVTAIGDAVTLAGKLASALGAISLNSGSLSGASGRKARGGPGPVPGANVVVANFHLHSSSRAEFSRQVREIGRELNRQQNVLAGGY